MKITVPIKNKKCIRLRIDTSRTITKISLLNIISKSFHVDFGFKVVRFINNIGTGITISLLFIDIGFIFVNNKKDKIGL